MGYRRETFAPEHIYHVYNRGVEKRIIFDDDPDRSHFRALLPYCLPNDWIPSYSVSKRLRSEGNARKSKSISEGEGLVDILCYCLMPNHFHLLIRENVEKGISRYMQRLLNSYARHYNTRHERTGPLFSGPFRAVRVVSDDQFLHVTRYIHLNPFVAGLVKDPLKYQWSSIASYLPDGKRFFLHPSFLKKMMRPDKYKDFVTDFADYARELSYIKHLMLEE